MNKTRNKIHSAVCTLLVMNLLMATFAFVPAVDSHHVDANQASTTDTAVVEASIFGWLKWLGSCIGCKVFRYRRWCETCSRGAKNSG